MHQRKLSRHNSRQSSIGETASQGSTKSAKSNGSHDHQQPENGTNRSKGSSKSSSQDSGDGTGSSPTTTTNTNILNVAEMLLHGVADNEILDIWLRSIQCEEFVVKFTDAGYDMPTISRITPQDLTAIGVTDPTKRLKILSEIKKLNLQDGLPNFRPSDLSHWLRLIRLDSYYYQSLCDQQVDTIEKLCQLTWEDFEELGISKLGHQKRIQLAVERLKEMESESNNKFSKKPMSEPIYDTNPSQILLVANTENHSMNTPIINKQSSTSELSSTGSGSMHSVYSAASTQYQSNYGPIPDNNHQQQSHLSSLTSNLASHQQQQAIYSQPPPPPLLYQQPNSIHQQLPLPLPPPPPPQQHQHQHHQQQQLTNSAPMHHQFAQESNGIVTNGTLSQQQNNRQSMSQLPFSALARLPKHQQQLLQQSSIYATLSRQPSTKPKQPPPPVPIRTNSLKPNSHQQQQHSTPQHQPIYEQQTQMSNCHTSSTNSLYRSANNTSRLTNSRGGQATTMSSQTMLTKNKSFSGNAHMEASRARFLNRNSQQQFQQLHQMPSHQIHQAIMGSQINSNGSSNQNFIYGTHENLGFNGTTNGSDRFLSGNASNCQAQYLDRTKAPPPPTQMINKTMTNQQNQIQQQAQQTLYRQLHEHDFDVQSDTQSTKSLIAPSPASSSVTSPVDNNGSPAHDSGSSQTLYNSASSGSNDQSLNMYNYSGDHKQQTTSTSSCTLNDANLILDSEQQQPGRSLFKPTTKNFSTPTKCVGGGGGGGEQKRSDNPVGINGANSADSNSAHCNATTGKDDNFPPPPSPLSVTEFDEHDLVSLTLDANFADANHGLMTFCVGI